MNTMTMERIEHEEAQKVAEKINIDWTELIDFTSSLGDVYMNIRNNRMDEDEAREAFREYFQNLANDLEWYAVQTGEEDDASEGSWDHDEASNMAYDKVLMYKRLGMVDDAKKVILSTWVNNYSDPYCKDVERVGEEMFENMGWEE